MSTVTDISNLVVRVVDDPDEVTTLRWFQTERYFDAGVILSMPTELEHDPLVERSVYFGVYTSDGALQACSRLVHPDTSVPVDQGGLPLLDHHELDLGASAEVLDNYERVLEVSRVAVAKNAPPHRALALMCREFFRYCLRFQRYESLVASVEEPLVRIIDHVLGIPVRVIGPPTEYDNTVGACYPIVIEPIRYFTEARWHQHRRWEFYTEDLVLDLTTGSPLGLKPKVTSPVVQAEAS